MKNNRSRLVHLGATKVAHELAYEANRPVLDPNMGSDSRTIRRYWRRTFICLFAAVLVLAVGAYLGRAPLLTGLAKIWVVDDRPQKADAIVVLGGGIAQRPFLAAKLYKDGLAPWVLYMNVKATPVDKLGISLTESELTRRVLLSNGVPDSALACIGNGVGSTYDESLAVREWLHKTGNKSIIITTDLFHTRRARWIFSRELKGENVKIQTVAAPLSAYGITNWWQNEEGLVAFETEVVKSAFYHVKY